MLMEFGERYTLSYTEQGLVDFILRMIQQRKVLRFHFDERSSQY